MAVLFWRNSFRCVVTNHINVTVHSNEFLFNNQPDASIIQIYPVTKIYMFRASSLPIISSSILTLLGSGHQKPAWNLPVPNVQKKTPDDGHRRCPKHVDFCNRINLINLCIWLVIKKICYQLVIISILPSNKQKKMKPNIACYIFRFSSTIFRHRNT